MKAILEFNLPKDQDEFILATKGAKYFNALWKFSQYLRRELKYTDELTHEQLATLEQVNKEFIEVLNAYNIDLNEIE